LKKNFRNIWSEKKKDILLSPLSNDNREIEKVNGPKREGSKTTDREKD